MTGRAEKQNAGALVEVECNPQLWRMMPIMFRGNHHALPLAVNIWVRIIKVEILPQHTTEIALGVSWDTSSGEAKGRRPAGLQLLVQPQLCSINGNSAD